MAKKLLIISHDAFFGAPTTLLDECVYLKNRGADIRLIFLGRGPLLEQFRDKVGGVLSECWEPSADQTGLKSAILKWKPDFIYANTIASVRALPFFSGLVKCPVVMHVHEMEQAFKMYLAAEELKQAFLKIPTQYIAVSGAAKENMVRFGVPAERIETVYEGIDIHRIAGKLQEKQENLRDGFDFVVGGAGTGYFRKGVDYWLQAAAQIKETMKPKKVRFVWMGTKDMDQDGRLMIDAEIRRLGLEENVLFTGLRINPYPLYQQFDVFLLSSREDPCPLVMLENMHLGHPVVAFEGCGGADEVVGKEEGSRVKAFDTGLMAEAAAGFLRDPELRRKAGEAARRKQMENHTAETKGEKIIHLLGVSALPRVTVLVLNWNRRQETLECLESVFKMNYRNFSVLVIDNGSTDGSVEAVASAFPQAEILKNGKNLGYAEGNNRGIRHAIAKGTDHILILNNDIRADEDLLDSLVEIAERHPLSLVCPQVFRLSEPAAVEFAGARWNPSYANFDVRTQPLENGGDTAVDTDFAAGCALFFQPALIRKAGYFDKRFFLLFEESDFCYRARRAGGRVMVGVKARVWHKGSASFKGGLYGAQYRYYFYRNRLLWMEKNLKLSERIVQSRYLWREFFELRKLSRESSSPEDRKLARAKMRGTVDYVFRRFGKARMDSVEKPRMLGIRTLYGHWGAHNGPFQYLKYMKQGFSFEMLLSPHIQKAPASALARRANRIVSKKSHWYCWQDLCSELRALGIAFSRPYDIVHYFDPEHGLQYLPRIMKKIPGMRKIKFFATFHQPVEIMDRLFNPESLKLLDAIFVYSPAQVEYFRKRVHGTNIYMLPHGVETSFFKPAAKKRENEKFICLTVGFWRRENGLLREVAMRLRGKGVEFHWVCPAEKFPFAQNDVPFHLHERLSDEDFRALYQRADLLVLPLSETTANNALVEAMACGLPSVVSDFPSVRLHASDDCALFLDNGNPAAWERTILELKENPSRRERMGLAARRRAEELSWEKLAVVHENIYREALS